MSDLFVLLAQLHSYVIHHAVVMESASYQVNVSVMSGGLVLGACKVLTHMQILCGYFRRYYTELGTYIYKNSIATVHAYKRFDG